MIIVYLAGVIVKTVEFDATIREVHLGTATPAEHPVQYEPDKTDDVHAERVRLSADCVVSNTPVVDTIGDVRGSYLPLVLQTTNRQLIKPARVTGGPGPELPIRIPFVQLGTTPEVTPAEYRDNPVSVSGASLQFPLPFDRVRSVYAELETLRRAGTRVQVVTSLKTYTEMVITSISAPVVARKAITFGLELSEVFIGASTLVDIPIPLEKRAEKVKAQGAQSTYDLPEQQSSLLKQGLQNLAEFSVNAGVL